MILWKGLEAVCLTFINSFKVGSNSSDRPYLLREKFVVIHHREARNPNEFPFWMVYGNLWIQITIVHLEALWEICTLWPISSSDSSLRLTSASIFAQKSPRPPIDFGPKKRMMAPAPAAKQVIIGTDRPLTALVASNREKEKN